MPRPSPDPHTPGDHADELIALTAPYSHFHSPEGQAFLSIPVGSSHQVVAAHSQPFRDHLVNRFRDAFHREPRPRKLNQALQAIASYSFRPPTVLYPTTRPVFLRAGYAASPAPDSGAAPASAPALALDLANDDAQTVEIRPNSWTVAANRDACFIQARTQSPLPIPTPANSPDSPASAPPDFEPLARFLRLHPAAPAFHRCLAWLLAAMRPSGPYPILVLRGLAGSGKSTAARALKSLLDPALAPLLPAPSSRRQLFKDAERHWILAFDHVGRIPNQVSDALCTLSSGIAHAVREPESRRAPAVYNLQRPLILVSTTRLKLNADLAARALFVDLDPVQPLSSSASDSAPDFEPLRAPLLAALCTAAARALVDSAPTAPARDWFRASSLASDAELETAFHPVPSPLAQSLASAAPFTGAATDLVKVIHWEGSPRHLSQEVAALTDPRLTIRFFHLRGERKIEISLSAPPNSQLDENKPDPAPPARPPQTSHYPVRHPRTSLSVEPSRALNPNVQPQNALDPAPHPETVYPVEPSRAPAASISPNTPQTLPPGPRSPVPKPQPPAAPCLRPPHSPENSPAVRKIPPKTVYSNRRMSLKEEGSEQPRGLLS